MAHPNEDLVRRAFDAFAKGDVDTMRELTDQDAVWHTPGRHPLTGDYCRSRQRLPRCRRRTAQWQLPAPESWNEPPCAGRKRQVEPVGRNWSSRRPKLALLRASLPGSGEPNG